MRKAMHADVVVIGGGIIGCSCAYYLARAGLKVHLVEKGSVGAGASKTCMSMIMTWKQPEIHMKLARASNRLFQELAAELPVDIEYRRTGSLAIVEQDSGLETFGESIRSLRESGVDCRLVGHDELVEMEPHVAPTVAGAGFFSEDAQVNPIYATHGLALGAAEHGAVIQPFAEVTGIELSTDHSAVVAVETTKGRIATEHVVNAAGAWSAEIARMVGLDVPVTPRKGHLIVTAPVPDSFLNCKILLSAGYMDSLKPSSDVTLSAGVQQVCNGNLLLGTSRQFVGFDTSIEPRVVEMITSHCLALVPALSETQALRAWTGLRPHTPDLLPILGPVDSVQGLHMACGHEGLGLTEGPITGRLIAQTIAGEVPDLPLDELSWSRFIHPPQEAQAGD
jgi:glycine/D-amino acid oxidase-like deaminating enzyme